MDYSIVDIQQFCARFYSNSQILVTPYNYTTTFGNVAPGLPATNFLVVLSNGDFVCLGLSHQMFDLSVVAPSSLGIGKGAPPYRVQIEDSGSNEKFFNDFVALENVSSNGVESRPFDYPRFIAGQTNLKIEVENFSTAVVDWDGFDLTLHGVLVRVFG
jgi:hypothetical protein